MSKICHYPEEDKLVIYHDGTDSSEHCSYIRIQAIGKVVEISMAKTVGRLAVGTALSENEAREIYKFLGRMLP